MSALLLKDCPCCGAQAVVVPGTDGLTSVRCTRCSLATPRDCQAVVVPAWNKRTHDPTPPVASKRLAPTNAYPMGEEEFIGDPKALRKKLDFLALTLERMGNMCRIGLGAYHDRH